MRRKIKPSTMREHGILNRVLLAYDEIIRAHSFQAGFPSTSRHRWRDHHPEVH